MASLLLAIEFLTVFPVRPLLRAHPAPLGPALAYFPAVGALLGACLIALDSLLAGVLALPVINALLVAFLAASTGALHLDGLLDSVDILTTGATPEERLRRFPRPVGAGSKGAAAVFLLLLGKYAALGVLHGPWRHPTLLVAPVLARWAVVHCYFAYPCGTVRPSLTLSLKQGATWRRWAVATLFTLAIAAASLGWAAIPAFLLALASATAVAMWAMSRLPGLTGDVYGAAAECTELLVLAAIPHLLSPRAPL